MENVIIALAVIGVIFLIYKSVSKSDDNGGGGGTDPTPDSRWVADGVVETSDEPYSGVPQCETIIGSECDFISDEPMTCQRKLKGSDDYVLTKIKCKKY